MADWSSVLLEVTTSEIRTIDCVVSTDSHPPSSNTFVRFQILDVRKKDFSISVK